jgi:EmrB/QacA subfamily drug resistance transporter
VDRISDARVLRTRRLWALTATIVGSSLTFIDATVVNVALPVLQTRLRATITDVQWIVEAYALFLGALILVGGSMGDQFGRKRVFLSGVVLFTVASALCGAALSPLQLIAGRALQGVGAALLVPGSLAIINATFPESERGRAIGTWSAFTAITTAIGPVTGGWLIEQVSWRAVFFVNVPLAAIVVVLSLRHMEESRDVARSAGLDWLGAALAVIGLGGVVFGLLEWMPLGAGHPLVWGSLVAGVASLALFGIAERHVVNPMMPLDLFRSRTFTLANGLTFLLYASIGIVFFLVPINLIQVQHYRPSAAGAALLPLPLIMFALSRWSGGLVAKIGSRIPLTVGPAVAAAGVALYARSVPGASYWTTFFPAVAVQGIGMAITVAPLTTTVMGAADPGRSGVVSGINNAVARVAGLLAIAVFGVVLGREFDAHVRPQIGRLALSDAVKTEIERQLPMMAAAELPSTLGEEKRQAVRELIDNGFLTGFRVVMIGAAALALAAAACGAALPSDTHDQRRASRI